MDIILVLLILVTVIGIFIFIGIVYLIISAKNKKPNNINDGLESIRNTLDNRLDLNAKIINEHMHKQLEQSNKLIKDITEELTEVKHTGKQMLSFTEQLQALENVLKNPQRRGILGERVLEQVIANVLPPNVYQIQYTFKKSGLRPDAVIFLQEGRLICIDAKFSLESYAKIVNGGDDSPELERKLRSDIKDRIKETAKYIIPEEGTLDYAFMFIPSESLYYDLLSQKIGKGSSKNFIEHAFLEYKVIIISPTTLLAYLQTVNLGLKSLEIEKNAQNIIKRANILQKHLENHAIGFSKMGNNINTVVNQYNNVQKEYKKIDKDFLKITGISEESDTVFLEKTTDSEE